MSSNEAKDPDLRFRWGFDRWDPEDPHLRGFSWRYVNSVTTAEDPEGRLWFWDPESEIW